MHQAASKIFHKISTKAEWGVGLITKDNYNQLNNPKFAFQQYIAKNLFLNEKINLDAIYFSGNIPTIYIKQLSTYNPSEIANLHRKFWNEGRTPLSIIITPDIIKVIDNFATPIQNENNINSLELYSFSTSNEDLTRLSEILNQSKLDSENIFVDGLSLKLNERVDKKLINQLRFARKILHEEYNLSFSVIHDLLGRSLFTLYLEDREIFNPIRLPQILKNI